VLVSVSFGQSKTIPPTSGAVQTILAVLLAPPLVVKVTVSVVST